jgi:hypothetical protein
MKAMTSAALSVIYRELGLLNTVKLGVNLILTSVFADPFKPLGPAIDQGDRLSRVQLKPVVLIYRHLLSQRERVEALRITEMIVLASGRAFLRDVLDGLDLHQLVASNERERLLRERLKQIPNATFSLRFEEDTLHFTVSACRFVQLCAQLSHPELTSLFCSVDDAFFGHDLAGVSLTRETTLATGGHSCPFVFSLHNENDADQ